MSNPRYRVASQKEAIYILSEPETIARTGVIPSDLIVQPWIVERSKSKMLFVFWERADIGELVFEVHIAALKRDIRMSRILAKDIMTWIFKHGAVKIVTNCPSGKISNMAEKLGMSLVKEDGAQKYYEVRSWV
jgi:hypothetical protein